MSDRGETGDPGGAARLLRAHLLAYALVNGALIPINLTTSDTWWFPWPLFGWGIVVAAHWLYVKSVRVDDEWADRRTEDLRLQAYDRGHIEDIEKRYLAGKSPDPGTARPRK